jgi:hypothetical protein
MILNIRKKLQVSETHPSQREKRNDAGESSVVQREKNIFSESKYLCKMISWSLPRSWK